MSFRDDNEMADVKEILCNTCKHYNRNYPPTCKAFPRGIPMSIISGETVHTKPVRGDKGIQYERS